MDEQPSKLWNVALVFSLLLLAAIAYVKYQPARTLVDTKCPWVKEQLTKYGIQIPDLAAAGQADADAAAPAPANAAPVSAPAAVAPAAFQAASTPAPAPVKAAPRTTLNLAQIAADQSVWPKKVRLKKDTTFPAVVDKKQVGKLSVPAGTEVGLYQVQADKLAVTYSPNGSIDTTGGTLVSPDDTDLVARVNGR